MTHNRGYIPAFCECGKAWPCKSLKGGEGGVSGPAGVVCAAGGGDRVEWSLAPKMRRWEVIIAIVGLVVAGYALGVVTVMLTGMFTQAGR